MSSCMCACVHLISLTGSMFKNVGVNMMPKENTSTLVINFLHSGTRTQLRYRLLLITKKRYKSKTGRPKNLLMRE